MDFAAMFQTWINVLTHPGEEAFEQELTGPNAKISTGVVMIIIAALIASVFYAISAVISSMTGGGMDMMVPLLSELDPAIAAELEMMMDAQTAAAGSIVGMAFATLCMSIFAVPIGFLIGSLIYFAIAKLFGGDGSFEEQTYLLATFSAPLIVVSAVVGIIPCVGSLVSFAVSIYQLVLTYFAIKVSHNLTGGKATGVILTPLLFGFVCACCITFMSIAFIASMAGAMAESGMF